MFAAGGAIWIKFGTLVQNDMPITAIWLKSQPGINSNDVCFPKTEIAISQSLVEIYRRNLVADRFWLLKSVTLLDAKPEVVLRSRGCHLGNG